MCEKVINIWLNSVGQTIVWAGKDYWRINWIQYIIRIVFKICFVSNILICVLELLMRMIDYNHSYITLLSFFK